MISAQKGTVGPMAGGGAMAGFRRLCANRPLIQSLVARELKARYRGSVLGFFWSFINPLMLLGIYTFVFSFVLPTRALEQPYAIFLFCGLLPWVWFSTSLLEGTSALSEGGNLVKKVLFPAEILPLVNVLAGMVHFLLGSTILFGALIAARIMSGVAFGPAALFFPVVVLVQLLLMLALVLPLSALSVYFRDIRHILQNFLMFLFFATPILYPLRVAGDYGKYLYLNPMTTVVRAYQDCLFYGRLPRWEPLVICVAASVVIFFLGFLVFDRLRDTMAEEV